jgi:hypothetical protein
MAAKVKNCWEFQIFSLFFTCQAGWWLVSGKNKKALQN